MTDDGRRIGFRYPIPQTNVGTVGQLMGVFGSAVKWEITMMNFRRSGGGFGGAKLIVALLIAGVALWRYFGSEQINVVTGESQRISIRPEQEVALGLQAAPELAQQFGGKSGDPRGQALVDQVGQEIVAESDAKKSPYKFEFHLLDDEDTVNAFAL